MPAEEDLVLPKEVSESLWKNDKIKFSQILKLFTTAGAIALIDVSSGLQLGAITSYGMRVAGLNYAALDIVFYIVTVTSVAGGVRMISKYVKLPWVADSIKLRPDSTGPLIEHERK